VLKRAFDLAIVIPAIVLLTPALAIIATCIKLDSQGPIIFKQMRIGRHEQPFRIYKFRTMVPNAEQMGDKITAQNDTRVTRCGSILRKAKLDEFPQLINVLLGDMSLVGPRPEVPEYVEYYPPDARELIFQVRPGITDQASIEFRDEEMLLSKSDNPRKTYIEEILPVKVKFYKKYASHHSLLTDILLLLRTLAAVVSPNRSS